MYKLYDFICEACDSTWEDLVEGTTSPCPTCTLETQKAKLCQAKLAVFSIKTPEEKKRSLLERSYKHTAKELHKEPERFGQEGKNRARAGQIRSFGGMKK
jgi:hypothetical protein